MYPMRWLCCASRSNDVDKGCESIDYLTVLGDISRLLMGGTGKNIRQFLKTLICMDSFEHYDWFKTKMSRLSRPIGYKYKLHELDIPYDESRMGVISLTDLIVVACAFDSSDNLRKFVESAERNETIRDYVLIAPYVYGTDVYVCSVNKCDAIRIVRELADLFESITELSPTTVIGCMERHEYAFVNNCYLREIFSVASFAQLKSAISTLNKRYWQTLTDTIVGGRASVNFATVLNLEDDHVISIRSRLLAKLTLARKQKLI